MIRLVASWCFACVALLTAVSHAAVDRVAVADTMPLDSRCSYSRCALAGMPAWNGLDLVRGEQQERVGRLGFFWTRDLSPVFAPEPHALEFAHRAVSTRRTAAVFTDLGAVLLVAAVAGAIANPDHTDTNAALAISGAVSLGIAVPLQFAADGHLSHAVWWHNLQFAR
jgi:hypothetical protein